MSKIPSAGRWKVYTPGNDYVASTPDVIAALVLVDFFGPNSTVREGHERVVWTEGVDGEAADSWDDASRVISGRVIPEMAR